MRGAGAASLMEREVLGVFGAALLPRLADAGASSIAGSGTGSSRAAANCASWVTILASILWIWSWAALRLVCSSAMRPFRAAFSQWIWDASLLALRCLGLPAPAWPEDRTWASRGVREGVSRALRALCAHTCDWNPRCVLEVLGGCWRFWGILGGCWRM